MVRNLFAVMRICSEVVLGSIRTACYFMVHLPKTARAPEMTPTKSKPLGGKHGTLVRLGGKISMPRQVLPQ